MRISQIHKNIENICSQNQSKICVKNTKFLIFDKTFNKIVSTPVLFSNFDLLVIPICIRQSFFSHMTIVFVTQTDVLYFDPDGEKCDIVLNNWLNSNFKNKNFKSLFQTHKNTKFECCFDCLKVLILIIKDGGICKR